MKTQLAVLLLAAMASTVTIARAQSTAFTYQGRLADGAGPANGEYDLRFILYNAPVGGSQAGVTHVSDNVAVGNGLFTTIVDFGAGVFNGTAYWLEIAVRPGASSGAFSLLDPRQPVTPTPEAIHAARAPWSGLSGVPAGFADGVDNNTTYTAGAGLALAGTQFSVNFGGSGSASTAARSDHSHPPGDAATLDGLDSTAFSRTTHTHSFSQITGDVADSQLSANVALLSGSATFNGTVTANADLRGARLNVGSGHGLTSARASIVGGLNNTNNGTDSTIGGGFRNLVHPSADDVTIAGGRENEIGTSAFYAAINGGLRNQIFFASQSSAIGGGSENTIEANVPFATIPGGRGARAISYGQVAHASGNFATPGDAQASTYVLRAATPDDQVYELFLDGTSQRIRIPHGGVMTFHMLVVATTSGTLGFQGWELSGVVFHNGSSTVVVTGRKVRLLDDSGNPATWDVNLATDNATRTLLIRATGHRIGAFSTPARWVANVRTAEVIIPR
jgi:hypothetical protein